MMIRKSYLVRYHLVCMVSSTIKEAFMYTNYPNNTTYYNEDDRFFLAPFLIGGLAGGALGYGIATNNNNKRENGASE